MIFELVQDYSAAISVMPEDHPRHRTLILLEEAIRREIHFIDRHPTTLFQCMWNTCWWYDCPEAANHYEEPEGWHNTRLPHPSRPTLSGRRVGSGRKEKAMTYLQVAEDRKSVSVVNEEGDVLVREVPAELILLAVPLLVTAAAVVATMPEGQRHTRPAAQLANMIQDICEEAKISPQGLRQMIIHAGLSEESQN